VSFGELIISNLLSPIVLAFVLGVAASLLKSDLRIPDPVHAVLSVYLLLAIGLKGGVELRQAPFEQVIWPLVGAGLLGLAIPLWCYPALRRLIRLSVPDAAAIAAHLGSVSVVTFVACISFLDLQDVAYERFLPAVVAVMEVPAIVVALVIAGSVLKTGGNLGEVIREILTGRSILLLLGGMIIGALTGPAGFEQIEALFVSPFKGILVLFMLEMGIVAAKRLEDWKHAGWRLAVFAVVAPIINGIMGIFLAKATGLSLGGATILATLSASASYIAAPAAVRIALPQANPSLYLGSSLGITFPFNLTAGIPLYYLMAAWIYGANVWN
jgi:uncharacterized protein